MKDWVGHLTRLQAILLIDNATDKEDPYWDYVVEDFYDEESDTWPSVYDVFAALGITESEYREATNSQEANIDWPSCDNQPTTAEVAELEAKVQELEAENRKLRYAWFRAADYATRSLSDLPTPPEVEHLELLEQGE